MAPHTIMCVDDEEPILFTLKLLLESVGFRVVTATSAAQALTLFNSEQIDAAVLDYYLPGMTGTNLAKRLKEARPNLPIVILSAYSELGQESLGLAEAWIRKSDNDPEQFLARLTDLVKGPPLKRKRRAST
jgi:CheY-like chemotaxis protein